MIVPKEKKGTNLKVWNPEKGEVEDLFP